MARRRVAQIPGAPPVTMPNRGGLRSIRTLIKRNEAKGITLPGMQGAVPVGVKASLTTAFAGANNDLVIRAVDEGVAGNSIRVQFLVGGANTPLSVSRTGNDITVNVGTNRGTDEVQTVTIGGAPTGGTFTLTFGGQTTSALAFNATAEAVEDALEALSTIGAGNVRVTGAAGGPYTVTFQNTMGAQNVAQMTAAHAFTGGASPSITVATTTEGAAAFGNSTAAQVRDILNGNVDTSLLVKAQLAAGNDGTGAVAALAFTNLAGGVNGNDRVEGYPTTASPNVLVKDKMPPSGQNQRRIRKAPKLGNLRRRNSGV